MYKTGAIIGRFQVPSLHEGHKYLLSKAAAKCHKLIVLVGVGIKDKSNPLTFQMRKDMILSSYEGIIEEVYPLHDIPGEDERWSVQIDIILNYFEDVMLFGSRDCFIYHYLGKHPFTEITEIPKVSGTKIRANIGEINSHDFRAGVIYGNKIFTS